MFENKPGTPKTQVCHEVETARTKCHCPVKWVLHPRGLKGSDQVRKPLQNRHFQTQLKFAAAHMDKLSFMIRRDKGEAFKPRNTTQVHAWWKHRALLCCQWYQYIWQSGWNNDQEGLCPEFSSSPQINSWAVETLKTTGCSSRTMVVLKWIKQAKKLKSSVHARKLSNLNKLYWLSWENPVIIVPEACWWLPKRHLRQWWVDVKYWPQL